MLVLDHVLINADLVAGGIFTPPDPTAADETKRAATLTLLTSGGPVELKDDAALLFWRYLSSTGKTIDKAQDGRITISKEAVEQLHKFFNAIEYSSTDFFSCKAIIDQLASRI